MKKILAIILGMFGCGNPGVIEINEYKTYDFQGQSPADVEEALLDFYYDRHYYIDRTLSKDEQYINTDMELTKTSMVLLQRISGAPNWFLMYADFPGSQTWDRIEVHELAQFILNGHSDVIERTMFQPGVEGKGLNER